MADKEELRELLREMFSLLTFEADSYYDGQTGPRVEVLKVYLKKESGPTELIGEYELQRVYED